MKLDNIFPISIARLTVDKEIVDETRALVYKFLNNTNFKSPPAPGELLTTFYKGKNFLGDLNATKLLHYINSYSREYLKLLGVDPTCYVEITSWLQLNQPQSYFVRHDHYGALVSGVLYITVPENSGDIIFHNPLEARRVTNVFFDRTKIEDNDYNFNHVKYSPIEGEMLFFESWLQHTVGQNLSKDDRVSVSFNIWVDKNAKS
jgi:uncharacterized protein (TIGR02466 family)